MWGVLIVGTYPSEALCGRHVFVLFAIVTLWEKWDDNMGFEFNIDPTTTDDSGRHMATEFAVLKFNVRHTVT
jgi:hypothetical protein